jgi:hypothetical protein
MTNICELFIKTDNPERLKMLTSLGQNGKWIVAFVNVEGTWIVFHRSKDRV